jgi:prepilin-type N-terminal cleavage/methylation domain-containing protein/prepilin-type processing-associated H-X9-DG protein
MARRPEQPAFTLIELLVVIAIIALLLSILLPSLKNAKALAKRVVCGTSLKGLSTAVATYAEDSDGRIVPYTIDQGGFDNKWPDGDTWGNMLVRGKCAHANNATKSQPQDDRSEFRCPEGKNERIIDWLGPNDSHRTDEAFRWQWCVQPGPGSGGISLKEIGGVCVRHWYAMNAGNQPYLPSTWGLGGTAHLSTWYKIGQIRKTSDLVMITEGSMMNQFYRPSRIAGRHPPISKNGRHGQANIAFWDGHVKVYDTLRFDNTLSGHPHLDYYEETIFYFDAEHQTGFWKP